LKSCQGGNSKVLWEKLSGYHSDDIRNSCSEFQLVTGCSMLDARCSMLDAGCWILDAGFGGRLKAPERRQKAWRTAFKKRGKLYSRARNRKPRSSIPDLPALFSTSCAMPFARSFRNPLFPTSALKNIPAFDFKKSGCAPTFESFLENPAHYADRDQSTTQTASLIAASFRI